MDGLSLVMREADPDLGAVPSEFSAPRDDDDDLLDLALGRVDDPRGGSTLVVCFACASFGVPVPGSRDGELVPLLDFELRPWQIRHATPLRRASTCTGATVFAGLLALMGTPASALAAATRGFVGTQAIVAQPGSVPEPQPSAPVAAPATTPSADTTPIVAPSEPIADPPQAAPVTPSVTGNLDDAFDALRGADVRVRLIDRSDVRGTLWGVTPQSFTLVDRATGRVSVYRRAAVVSIEVLASPSLPKRGLASLITGGVLTGAGVPTLIAGAVMVGITPSYLGYGLPPLIIGTAATAVGIALLAIGQRRNAHYRQAVREARPRVQSRRPQWTGGLSFRF